MQAPRIKAFGLGRIVALALISLSASGLIYLHFSLRSDSVSLPSGAKAGQLKLHPCHSATENGSYRADCGTLVVRENRHKADSGLIALPVTRIRARFAKPGVPIFRLQGGPGLTNMEFADASRFADKHDVVLVGYRGVDGSSKLDCPEVTSAREHTRDFLSEKSYRADAAALTACAHRLQHDGVDLGFSGTPRRRASRSTATPHSARRTPPAGAAHLILRRRFIRRTSTFRGTSGSCRSRRATSTQRRSSA